MNDTPLFGKATVVTGASSGIGKAIAFRFAEEGAHVVVSSRNLAGCENVAGDIATKGGRALAISCDVRLEQDIKNLFDRTELEFGGVDIVVANAGISGGSVPVADYSLERWNEVLETNLTGCFLTVREAFRRMKLRGGHIIVMSSQAGVQGFADKGPYCAAKFGVRGLAHALGEEGRKYNISVSTLCPGTVATPILAASNTNVKNPMEPRAVADAAVLLAVLRGNSMIRDIILERMLLD